MEVRVSFDQVGVANSPLYSAAQEFLERSIDSCCGREGGGDGIFQRLPARAGGGAPLRQRPTPALVSGRIGPSYMIGGKLKK